MLLTALSQSSTFQAEAGTDEATVKNRHILLYQDSTVDDLSVLKHERPIAVLGIESQRWVQVAQGPTVCGGVVIAMRIYVDDDKNKKNNNDKYIAACDFLGQVFDDLTSKLGTMTTADFGNLSIEMVEPIDRTEIASRNESQDVWPCKYIVDTVEG